MSIPKQISSSSPKQAKKQAKLCSDRLKKDILNRQKNDALSLFISELQNNEIYFVSELKKSGVLRCSTYDFDVEILNFLINNVQGLTLCNETQRYFKSLTSLFSISRNIQNIFKDFLKEVSFLEMKSYLVTLDSLFYSHSFHQDSSFEQQKDNEWFLCREDLASAFSLYYFYVHKNDLVKQQKLSEINEYRLSKKYYLKKLKEFYKIIFYKECELFIDYFNYLAIKNNTNVVLNAPNENFGKSLDHGYIYNHIQEIASPFNTYKEISEQGIQSIFILFEEYYKNLNQEIFEIIDKPVKRIVLKLFYTPLLKKIITSETVFLEEAMSIHKTIKDLFIPFSEFKKTKVYKSLSFIDILVAQRLFQFIYFIFEKSSEIFKSKLFHRSMLPVFEAGEFKNHLIKFLGSQQAQDLIDVLSYNPERDKIFDIQYKPLLCIEDWIILPLAILVNSNLIRNILSSTGFRFDSESSKKPIELQLEKYLKPISSTFQSDLEYNFKGDRGDVDVFTILDNRLFVFECKNSLNPCNIFELRTTYDYIQKGAKQLARFQILWQQEDFRKYIANRLKIEYDCLPHQFYSCIVMGNRMFSGLREQGYAVRSVHQLCSFIDYGKIDFHIVELFAQDNNQYSSAVTLWKGENFTVNDLIEYLNNDSLYECYSESMKKVNKKIKLKNKFLIQESYVLDSEDFFKKLDFKF